MFLSFSNKQNHHKSNTNKLKTQVEEKEEPIEKGIKKIEKVLEEIDASAEKCCQVISLKFEELIKKMKERERERELIEKVDEFEECSKERTIDSKKGDMSILLHGIQSTTEFTQIVIENGTNIKIKITQKHIFARSNTLINFPFYP